MLPPKIDCSHNNKLMPAFSQVCIIVYQITMHKHDKKGPIPKVFLEEFNICLQQMLGCVVKRQGQHHCITVNVMQGAFFTSCTGEKLGDYLPPTLK